MFSLCLLHCALASCGAVYCNRSCLWVCDSGRAVSEPYYSQRAQCLRLSERFFHLFVCLLVGWITQKLFTRFLPHKAMRKRGLCCSPVSVCPSVRLSRWCIVSRRLKISSNFFVGPIAHHISFLTPAPVPNSKGNTFSGGAGKGVCGWAKIFGSALQPARRVCVSLSAFFIINIILLVPKASPIPRVRKQEFIFLTN